MRASRSHDKLRSRDSFRGPSVINDGCLSTVKFVEAQAGYLDWLCDWYVSPPGVRGFILFMIAAMAESKPVAVRSA